MRTRKDRAKRVDDQESEDRGQRARKDEREDHPQFENQMFADDLQSPLYIPPDRWPDGMALRWVAIEVNGAAFKTNWNKRTYQGWRPVPRSMYEDMFPNVDMPGNGDISDGAIIFGGLCLCQRPMHLVLRDKARQEQETRLQGQSIQQYVEGGNSNFPRQISADNTTRGRQMAFKE